MVNNIKYEKKKREKYLRSKKYLIRYLYVHIHIFNIDDIDALC